MNRSQLRQFRRTRASADGVFSFVHAHRAARLRDRDRGRQTVWSGADDNRVDEIRWKTFVRRMFVTLGGEEGNRSDLSQQTNTTPIPRNYHQPRFIFGMDAR